MGVVARGSGSPSVLSGTFLPGQPERQLEPGEGGLVFCVLSDCRASLKENGFTF